MQKKPEFGFGTHLTIDGYGCNPAVMESMRKLEFFLRSIPRVIGMTPISEPHLIYHTAHHPDDSGPSGFIIIAESHISFHCFPSKGYASVDVFSCKPFDPEQAGHVIAGFFGMKKYETRVFDRGQEYPNDASAAAKITTTDRRRLLRT